MPHGFAPGRRAPLYTDAQVGCTSDGITWEQVLDGGVGRADAPTRTKTAPDGFGSVSNRSLSKPLLFQGECFRASKDFIDGTETWRSSP